MLADTKERALPAHPDQTLEDYLVYLKHIALYAFAKKFCANQHVLDMGCGEGYGSDVLAGAARIVIAADYSFETVTHAQTKYHRANIAFVVCDAQALPFKAESFDTIISFEVIEHIPVVSRYLTEIRRALRVSGVSIISTPNSRMRLLPFQKPWNRFHLREYDDRGLARAMSDVFARVQMLGITALPSILDIEKQRVKQNPLIAYPKMLAQMFLPNGIYNQLRKIKLHFAPATELSQTKATLPNFSANDFSVTENDLRDCINLVAIGSQVTR
jgi:2-polyprenyl-3-methyl-5-hydroxy-6-metoxy-1,4-benzoquinol methylase